MNAWNPGVDHVIFYKSLTAHNRAKVTQRP